MSLKTPEQYKDSLLKLRPNIYKFGEPIADVTTSPHTRSTVEGHAQLFAAALDPEYADLFSTTSQLTGQKVSRYLSVNRCADDMVANCKMKRAAYHLTGTCTGGRCAGYNAINSMWATTHDMDQELGTDYHQRLTQWLLYAQENDLTISGALTDPKGNRSLPPSQQEDPDMNLHIVENRPDGIVVRGAKVMICGTAAAQEVFVLPGSGYREPDKDYAVAFVIPRDIEGLTIVEARHPSDTREAEEGFDIPVKLGGITQAYLFFQDVFVPKDRVFLCGEFKYSTPAVLNFIMPYRTAIGSCVAGQGDLMCGAAALIARANGLSTRAFNEKLTRMYVNNETTFGMGVAASVLGKQHPSGAWLCDPLLSNVNKVHVATLPYETKALTQDIAGGIGETGCLPSYRDFTDPAYGHLLQKYLKAASSGEARAKIARLIEWLTLGAGVPGCMHGGGSQEGAKLMVRANAGLEKFVEYARRLIDLQEDVPEPARK
ncbi:MAG: 4-hydroxyphenylacetate 3-hydroxylase N-terminal domain-containing protein [Chloroflexota bacterium]